MANWLNTLELITEAAREKKTHWIRVVRFELNSNLILFDFTLNFDSFEIIFSFTFDRVNRIAVIHRNRGVVKLNTKWKKMTTTCTVSKRYSTLNSNFDSNTKSIILMECISLWIHMYGFVNVRRWWRWWRWWETNDKSENEEEENMDSIINVLLLLWLWLLLL